MSGIKSGADWMKTSNEINNLIYEQMIEILYKPAYMGESRHPGNIYAVTGQCQKRNGTGTGAETG
ncbi:Uncharacterised protein [Morganella morganii]|nr:Uncharacterised protein [Morganella morganii]